MRTYLSFNLPEDTDALKDAQNGYLFRIILSDLLAHLRELKKYKNKSLVKIEYVEDYIRTLARERGVEI